MAARKWVSLREWRRTAPARACQQMPSLDGAAETRKYTDMTVKTRLKWVKHFEVLLWAGACSPGGAAARIDPAILSGPRRLPLCSHTLNTISTNCNRSIYAL